MQVPYQRMIEIIFFTQKVQVYKYFNMVLNIKQMMV